MSNITFLDSFNSEIPDGSVVRAGGTDLQQRLRSSNSKPHIADLTGVADYAGISQTDSGVRIGAGTTITRVAQELSGTYPALARTASGLATPQIRATGTIGGNLMQHTRCWYYRHPDLGCFKSGGDNCPAREGRHLYGVVFDNADCVHPHPSSLAMALLIYDATVSISGAAISASSELSIGELLGDGSDATRDNQLPEGALVAAINLPKPWSNEQAVYYRSISRFEAEWPLVEAVARAAFTPDGAVASCAIGLGGVATVPLKLVGPAAQLVGKSLDQELINPVAKACTEGAAPLPETGYKVDLIEATVRHVLEQLSSSNPVSPSVVARSAEF